MSDGECCQINQGGHFYFLFILQELMAALQAQAANLQNIHCLGGEILASCHPDSIITIKSWISVTKTRYEEVSVKLFFFY